MKKTFLLPFMAGLLALNLSNAQDKNTFHPCGTTDGKSDWLIDYQLHKQGFPRTGDTLYVPVTIHIVGTDDGAGYFSLSSLYRAFCTLNSDFAPSSIQFYIEDEINYINNTDYYDHTFSQGSDMMQEYKVPNTINCYIVSSPADNCGYSSYNQGVALAKSCVGPSDHTWAHEIGHFLSLPHPFYGWEGFDHNYGEPAPAQIDNSVVERVDGEYCEFAGDGFCDTPADYLNYRWPCDSEGKSTVKQVDPNGEEFFSDGTLFMSYSLDNCSSRFSDEQIAAMRANLLTEKEDYLYNQTPLGPVDMSNFTPISPAPGEILPIYNNVHFAWEPVPNATQYTIEVTPLENFAVAQYRYVTEATNFTSYDLDENKKYYWRVSAINNYHTCTSTSEIFSFETGGQVNATQEISHLSALALQPNPVRAGQEVLIGFETSERLPLTCQLLALTGEIVQQQNLETVAGYQQLRMQTESLPAGLYLLHLKSGSGNASLKLAVVR